MSSEQKGGDKSHFCRNISWGKWTSWLKLLLLELETLHRQHKEATSRFLSSNFTWKLPKGISAIFHVWHVLTKAWDTAHTSHYKDKLVLSSRLAVSALSSTGQNIHHWSPTGSADQPGKRRQNRGKNNKTIGYLTGSPVQLLVDTNSHGNKLMYLFI